VSPEELGARVRAVLRRTGERSEDGVVRGSDIEVHLDQRLVLRHGRPLPLTRREWQILRELAVRRGRPVPAKQLLTDVFGEDYAGDEEFLAVWLARLRRKLETEPPGPAVIERTDDGYRFVVDSRGA
jgi:DNA-binding response OmpR family regulator